MDWFSTHDALGVLQSLGLPVLGMVVYSILIFNYYRFLAKRDIIRFDLDRYKDTGDRVITSFLNVLLTILVYPIVVFVWFALLATILGFLGKNQSTDGILLVSMALVSTVRVAAYYHEDLSKDLAKMLPFALLGIYLVDQSYFNFQMSLSLIEGIPTYWHNLVYYFMFIFGLELLLRVVWIITQVPAKSAKKSALSTDHGQFEANRET